jgi:hypothetical protein
MSGINSAVGHWVGVRPVSPSASFLYSYLSNIHFIDGQALTPSSFGRTSADTLQWVNKTYAGTYGNNGFKLDFANSADLGNDVSGNNNDWTTNGGITSANQYTDTPTNNHCVLNALANTVSATAPTKGNLVLATGATWNSRYGTIKIPAAGKWYFEGVITSTSSASIYSGIGVCLNSDNVTHPIAGNSLAYCWGLTVGEQNYASRNVSGTTNFGGTTTAGTTLQLAVDMDAGKIWLGKNDAWLDSVNGTTGNPSTGANAFGTGLNGLDLKPIHDSYNQTTTFNFGAKAFTYTPPTGFKALNTANLATPAILDPSDHFYAKVRTGTGAAYNVTGIPFAPDLVESKSRSAATDWAWYDSVRGVQNQLESNTTTAETTEATGLTAFNSDGYSGGALAQMNTNAATYIDYMWKMGGAAVSNTNGSITSSVSANTLAGQSIVKITAGTAANATVGHGLTSAPELIIAKAFSQVTEWPVYCSKIANTEYLVLTTTAAKATGATYWNSTTPTSTVFSLGSATNTNNTNGMLFYCFHSVEGYSKVFSYSGNSAADGPFVNCGFKPKYVLIKRTDSTSNWTLFDSARNTYNGMDLEIYPDISSAESAAGGIGIDFTATGFKLRRTGGAINVGSYVGIAFAEAHAKFSTAR